jgi:aminobenzoyl-glutamate utilization protein A
MYAGATNSVGARAPPICYNRVQKQGGIAGYVGIGTDHPGGHHTATFDIDEDSLLIGVEVLSDSLIRLLETVEPGAT